jgi:hypothetical protein
VWGTAAAYGYGCVYLDGLAEVTEILPLLPFLLGAKSQSAIQSTTVVYSAWVSLYEILRRGATEEEKNRKEQKKWRLIHLGETVYACVCRHDCSRTAGFSFGAVRLHVRTPCVSHISHQVL